MANDKKQIDGGSYVDIEIDGTTYKVKKLTGPTDGRVFAWEGLVDIDGKQIICSERAIEQVLEDHPHLQKHHFAKDL